MDISARICRDGRDGGGLGSGERWWKQEWKLMIQS